MVGKLKSETYEEWLSRSREYNRNIYAPKHKKEHTIRNREYFRKIKKNIFNLLGGKCSNPYNIDHSSFEQLPQYFKVLQIDHINGDGKKDRKKFKACKLYYYILTQLQAGSKDYQLLCPTCNWIKRIVNKEQIQPKEFE